MTASATAKLRAYVSFAVLGLVAAVILGAPDLVALALPFAVAVAIGLGNSHQTISCAIEVDRDRLLTGEVVHVGILLDSARSTVVELRLAVEPGLEWLEPENGRVPLRAGETQRADLAVRCHRWGAYALGLVELRTVGPLGLVVHRRLVDQRRPVRVYPRPEELGALLSPGLIRSLSGDLVSRSKGEGIEFADIREFVHGDQIRHINWAASARHGQLHVNEYRPERNSEVVIFLDSFLDLGAGAESTLARAVGAAFTLAEAHLGRRDRVGLVSYGGLLTWLTPAAGLRQLYRIIEALLDVRVFATDALRDVDVLPQGLLSARALIVALSPLVDPRCITAVLGMRARGLDVLVVELPPDPPLAGESQAEQLAFRLWTLQRRATRATCEAAGAIVVPWPPHAPLRAVIDQATQWLRLPRGLFV